MTEYNNMNFTGHYEIFILALCIFALCSIAVDTFIPIDRDTRAILFFADNIVCIIFFIDFLNSLWKSDNRWRYFVTWGWIDLISSIPAISALRWGRAARIFRIIRILRAARATRHIACFILMKRTESAFLAATLLTILLITFSSIAIVQIEDAPGANIKTPEDAIWWSLATLTTVGYGDRFPVTSEGRAIGAVLMISGIGLFGLISGFLASWFLSPIKDKEEGGINEMRREISELRTIILSSRDKTSHPGEQNGTSIDK